MRYRLTEDPAWVVRDDGAKIPVEGGIYLADEYRSWLADGNIPGPAPAPPPPAPLYLRKVLIVERLAAAKKLRLAMVALKLDVPAADLSDDELELRERWLAATFVLVTPQAEQLITAIGADPAVILAPDIEGA